MSPEKVIRCLWCKQHIPGKVEDWNNPAHPDCIEYGLRLMELNWTPTRGYVDTPEVRKAMREQFQDEKAT